MHQMSKLQDVPLTDTCKTSDSNNNSKTNSRVQIHLALQITSFWVNQWKNSYNWLTHLSV